MELKKYLLRHDHRDDDVQVEEEANESQEGEEDAQAEVKHGENSTLVQMTADICIFLQH